MIAISSFRPHNLSDTYARNQALAHASWHPFFSRILYVGNHEPDLSSGKTAFYGFSGFPSLRDIASRAAAESEMVAWINADIILTDPFADVQRVVDWGGILGATSYRYQFHVEQGIDTAKVTDKGLDIWITTPHFWRMIADEAPAYLGVSVTQVDTWLCGFMVYHMAYAFRHFTPYRCVFHPYHEERIRPSQPPALMRDKYSSIAKLPAELQLTPAVDR